MDSCLVAMALQFTTAVFALMAAVLWIRSSSVKMSNQIGYIAVFSEMAANDDLEKIAIALKRQGRLSARAAICAAIAALLQFILVFMPACAGFLTLG